MSGSTKQAGRKPSAKAGSAKGKGKASKSATRVVPAETPQVTVDSPRASIRQLIRTEIQAGRSTEEITARLTELFPKSMAAQKPGKHISFYRSQLKKEARAASQEA